MTRIKSNSTLHFTTSASITIFSFQPLSINELNKSSFNSFKTNDVCVLSILKEHAKNQPSHIFS